MTNPQLRGGKQFIHKLSATLTLKMSVFFCFEWLTSSAFRERLLEFVNDFFDL